MYLQKSIDDVLNKTYMVNREYQWLPKVMINKKLKIKVLKRGNFKYDKYDLDIQKIYDVKKVTRTLVCGRIFIPKSLLNSRIKFEVV